MRTFKFRVYIPGSKEGFSYFELGNFEYSDRYLDQDDYPVQQFTGFLDKNQTPIYEGDIVKDTHYGERTAKIVYDLGCFWLDSNHISQDLERELYDSTQDSLEVIGNIFENEI